ncbi:hypothetical protein Scep_028673 [Stephania cephalantha]|uniref:Uncharacterized protein n=1 Tax=Stephania cephalantha TaxID=152367 RepID=A0AAP0EAC9_9MAGN
MKLLECVSCFAPFSIPAARASGAAPVEENRELERFVDEENDRFRGRNRESTQWKPTLCAITEDRAVTVVPGRVERRVPRRVPSTAMKKPERRPRNPYSDDLDGYDLRQTEVPVAIPAFTPMGIFM